MHLEIELKDFNEDNQHLLVFALAAFLGIPPKAIKIYSIEGGSVKVILRLPEESAECIVKAFAVNNPELREYLEPFFSISIIKSYVPLVRHKRKTKAAELIISKARTKSTVRSANISGEFYGALDKKV